MEFMFLIEMCAVTVFALLVLGLFSKARAAIGTGANMKIYDQEFWGGFSETIAQNSDVFNAASRNALRLTTAMKRGNFEKESFVTRMSGLVSRRDVTSTSAATIIAMAQDESIRVKLNRKIGPVENTLDSWKKVAPNESAQREMSFAFGEQAAKAASVDMVDAGLIAVEAALDGVVAVEHNRSAGTMRHVDLADGLGKMGDQAGLVVAWVMHSKVATDLLKASITDKVTNVANVSIIEGTIATLGRPTIIVDSPALQEAASPTTYVTLGLKEGAVDVIESEQRDLETEIVLGGENLNYRIQGEFAMNVGVLGFKYSSGTVNPTDAQLGTSGNWTQVFASHKALAGCRIYSQ